MIQINFIQEQSKLFEINRINFLSLLTKRERYVYKYAALRLKKESIKEISSTIKENISRR